ncbi:hypothetical protein SAMN04488029_3743 [Reichenbachiella faecimaris]|uniref:UDP-glucose 4-epimerase n=1 Tax=Reichenbachiella faecimaris TaxID=692418 RepID=A0A1W2GNS6_REIFA|nr:DUF779 domain-containing protein [Reichenbachiella faecimaris]SMD38319.1 hypothetical protein SAMN04488029_3743 [Reichenbachiella faecimaris]
MVERILITEEAKAVVDTIRQQHPSLIFHQSGGCCDGSSPMCFEEGELMLDDSDVWLGTVHGCKCYMSRDQFEYWKHTQITIDVVKGRGASFSLEIPLGVRFLIRSRLFTEEEMIQLDAIL